jgi:uncharacterized protein (DUF1697 family)
METFVALLRGINVGGRTIIPMAELRSSVSALGLQDVVTYVQSGNVVFRTHGGGARDLAASIEERVASDFGVGVAVLLRTPSDLRAVAEQNPFLARGEDPSRLHVMFLDREPAAEAATRLDPERSPPEEFALAGREMYLYLPNGAGRSKLTLDYFEKRLGVRATVRNWRTLTKLIELTEKRS